MTKEAALHMFFNGFSIPGYPATAVPEDSVFPWLTYENTVDAWGGGDVGITVNVWYYGTDEAPVNAKVREISDSIGLGGVILPCDGGSIWVKRGSPWSNTVRDDADQNIKRRTLNVTAEYMTMN